MRMCPSYSSCAWAEPGPTFLRPQGSVVGSHVALTFANGTTFSTDVEFTGMWQGSGSSTWQPPLLYFVPPAGDTTSSGCRGMDNRVSRSTLDRRKFATLRARAILGPALAGPG
jgi:hypothetical protein